MRRPMRRRGRRVENWARRVALTGVIAITYILSGFLRVGGTVHTKESAMALCSAIAVARRFPPPLYRRVQASPLETFLTNLSLFADAAPDRPPPPSPSRPSPVQSTSHALYVHTTVSCNGNAASPNVPVGVHKPSLGRINARTTELPKGCRPTTPPVALAPLVPPERLRRSPTWG